MTESTRRVDLDSFVVVSSEKDQPKSEDSGVQDDGILVYSHRSQYEIVWERINKDRGCK